MIHLVKSAYYKSDKAMTIQCIKPGCAPRQPTITLTDEKTIKLVNQNQFMCSILISTHMIRKQYQGKFM